MGRENDVWTSASDLAEYVYCPRSHWYRHHPPRSGPSRASQRSAGRGVRYHDRVLTAERHHAERGGTYWVVLVMGFALMAVGAWWIFRP